jgi:D-tyrosyl-tRNA(Tyr) deacylase
MCIRDASLVVLSYNPRSTFVRETKANRDLALECVHEIQTVLDSQAKERNDKGKIVLCLIKHHSMRNWRYTTTHY